MAVFLVLGSVLSLQFGAAFASGLFDQVGPAGATTLRLSIAALVLVALARPRWRSWNRDTAVLGIVMACMNGTFYLALDRIPLGIAVTVEFLGPLGLAAVLSRRWRDSLWVVLALTGVVLLGVREYDGAQSLDLVGVALALLAGVFWAAYVVVGSRVATAGDGAAGLAVASVVAGVVTLPFGVASGGWSLLSPDILLLGLFVAVLASVIPYSLELRALKTLPAKSFGVILALEPAAAALAGGLLLGEHLSVVSYGAIVLVITAGIGAAVRPTAPARPGTRELPDADRSLPVPL